MKFLLYFAVTCFNDYIYLSEKKMDENPRNSSELLDLIDDYEDLKSELDWSRCGKNNRPNKVGCYQAVVEYRQTAEDDYSLDVLSCTPAYII